MKLTIDGTVLAEAPMASASMTRADELVISAPALNLVLSLEETAAVRAALERGYREDA